VKFSGERVIPGETDPDLLNEHRARYWFARRFCSGKKVLDAACGTGYGSALLGENAAAVFGMDISAGAIEYACRHYRAPNLHFCQSDCLALPFPSEQFEVVVAFEIIEHVPEPEAFLQELRRVLHPGGLLLLSTPNRLYYTEERGEVNPFHHREFSFPELEQALSALFPHRTILLQNHVPALLISSPGQRSAPAPLADAVIAEGGAGGEPAPERQNAAHYFVAVCSRQPLETVAPLLYLPSTANVLREREKHIAQLEGYLAEAKSDLERARSHAEQREKELNQLLEERTQWARTLSQQISEKDAYILQLQADYDRKVQWSQGLEQDLEKARADLQNLQADYENKIRWAQNLERDVEQARAALHQLQQEFEERTAWALKLDAELKDRFAELRLLYDSLWYRIGKNLRLSPVPSSDRSSPPRGNS